MNNNVQAILVTYSVLAHKLLSTFRPIFPIPSLHFKKIEYHSVILSKAIGFVDAGNIRFDPVPEIKRVDEENVAGEVTVR